MSGMRAIFKAVLLVLGGVALPAALGAPATAGTLAALNAPRADNATVSPAPVEYDPAKPTAVVVVGDKGAVASDTLAPYEILATTGKFNVYAVASTADPLPLTGGLDLVPDLTFAELEDVLGGPADLVVVPAMPDVGRPTTKPVTDWLTTQASGGALILSVCNGAAVVASTGILDGHKATAHWLRIDDWENSYPDVDWVRETRYVDDGDMISTAGILSGIDGTLHVVERLIGTDAAADAAQDIEWPYYESPTRAQMEQARLEPSDAVVALNAGFGGSRAIIGIQLSDGVGEIELASVFDTYAQSLAVDTIAVGEHAVRSRHGLTFVPRTDTGAGLDRLIVPGTMEHDVLPGPETVHPHRQPGFAYDPVLQDLARTTDLATAQWTAKALEYPTTGLNLHGSPWPWGQTLRLIALAITGVLVFITVSIVASLRATRAEAEPVFRRRGRVSSGGKDRADV